MSVMVDVGSGERTAERNSRRALIAVGDDAIHELELEFAYKGFARRARHLVTTARRSARVFDIARARELGQIWPARFGSAIVPRGSVRIDLGCS